MENNKYSAHDLVMKRPSSAFSHRWLDATPIGNGETGVLFYGGVAAEHLVINRSDMWYDGEDTPVSCGWDNNPRFRKFRKGVVKGNTPENVEKAFRRAKEYLDRHLELPPLVTVNSWNEWTETSYLQPDDLYGYGYLEAIKKVFQEE